MKVCAKKTYPDRKAVVTALNALMRGGRGRPAHGLRFYQCGSCGGWHLTKARELDWKRTRAERGERRARKLKPERRFHMEHPNDDD